MSVRELSRLTDRFTSTAVEVHSVAVVLYEKSSSTLWRHLRMTAIQHMLTSRSLQKFKQLHENPPTNFGVILLTDKQTNTDRTLPPTTCGRDNNDSSVFFRNNLRFPTAHLQTLAGILDDLVRFIVLTAVVSS